MEKGKLFEVSMEEEKQVYPQILVDKERTHLMMTLNQDFQGILLGIKGDDDMGRVSRGRYNPEAYEVFDGKVHIVCHGIGEVTATALFNDGFVMDAAEDFIGGLCHLAYAVCPDGMEDDEKPIVLKANDSMGFCIRGGKRTGAMLAGEYSRKYKGPKDMKVFKGTVILKNK